MTASSLTPVARAEPEWRGLRPGLRERLVTPMPSDRLIGWGWPLVITLLAGYLRLRNLGKPDALVFDEVYYAHDSYSLLQNGVERGPQFTDPAFVVHPPLGKWMIAFGQWMYGGGETTIEGVLYPGDRFGWRFSAAVVGTLAVLILARTVRRMTRSTLLGCVAGLLLALDGLAFVESRIAMLDIFLMFWIVAAFACLVADRDDGRRRLADRLEELGTPYVHGPRLGFRPWRLATAVCLGAAVSTKWSALWFILLFAALSFFWDVSARRAGGSPTPYRVALRYDLLPLNVLYVLLIPVLYVASWAGWFATSGGYDRQWASQPGNTDTSFGFVPDVLRSFWHYHWEIWHFHQTLDDSHPYQSHSWTWLALARPVSYFYSAPTAGEGDCRGPGNCSQEILGIGTPAIWWAVIPALFVLLWLWVARSDWRAGAAVLGIAVTIGPWIYSDLKERTMFLFYALPAVPFMVIGLTVCIGYVLGSADASLTRRQVGATLAGAYLLLVALNFFWLYPVLAADVIPYSGWSWEWPFGGWRERMWFPSWI